MIISKASEYQGRGREEGGEEACTNEEEEMNHKRAAGENVEVGG